MPWGGVNRVMKYTNQCHRCYTFPYSMLLIHAVGLCKLVHEMYKSMSQLQINAVGVVRLIAYGWRQPTLGYMCNKEFNAVGVSRYSNECVWQLKCPHGATPYFLCRYSDGCVCHGECHNDTTP